MVWKVEKGTPADAASDGLSTAQRCQRNRRSVSSGGGSARGGIGQPGTARVDADAALKLAPNRNVRTMAALALARAGDTADKLAAGLDQTFPLDTLVQRYWLPTVHAAIALEQKDPKRAVELLKVSSSIELGQPTIVSVFLCPVYLRGEAFLMLHDSNAAAAEFQKFIDHYGLITNFPWGALARLGLTRA